MVPCVRPTYPFLLGHSDSDTTIASNLPAPSIEADSPTITVECHPTTFQDRFGLFGIETNGGYTSSIRVTPPDRVQVHAPLIGSQAP
jgi:hypothetical protein